VSISPEVRDVERDRRLHANRVTRLERESTDKPRSVRGQAPTLEVGVVDAKAAPWLQSALSTRMSERYYDFMHNKYLISGVNYSVRSVICYLVDTDGISCRDILCAGLQLAVDICHQYIEYQIVTTRAQGIDTGYKLQC